MDEEDLDKKVAGERLVVKDNRAIDLNLPPEPFLGPLNAKLLVLLLNPGIGELTYTRQRLVGAIKDPEACDVHPWLASSSSAASDIEGGVRWWRKLVKGLASIGRPEEIGRNLMSVEFFPYRSIRFGAAHVRVPSQEFSFHLVREAMKRDAAIVLARGRHCWFGAVPELADYHFLLKLKNPQSASLSVNNLESESGDAFDRLVERLRAHN